MDRLPLWSSLFLILMGTVFALFCIWFGSAGTEWVFAVSWAAESVGGGFFRFVFHDLVPFAWIAAIVSAAVAGGRVLFQATWRGSRRGFSFRELDTLIQSLICLACFAFLFGAFAVPIAGGRTNLEMWKTPWLLLLIAGGCPLSIIIRDLEEDLGFSLRTRRTNSRFRSADDRRTRKSV